jgi:hypothetical protein
MDPTSAQERHQLAAGSDDARLGAEGLVVTTIGGADTQVQCLKLEGVHADWTPPVDALGDEPVLINIAARGSSNAVKECVREFRARYGHGRVEIEGEDD